MRGARDAPWGSVQAQRVANSSPQSPMQEVSPHAWPQGHCLLLTRFPSSPSLSQTSWSHTGSQVQILQDTHVVAGHSPSVRNLPAEQSSHLHICPPQPSYPALLEGRTLVTRTVAWPKDA